MFFFLRFLQADSWRVVSAADDKTLKVGTVCSLQPQDPFSKITQKAGTEQAKQRGDLSLVRVWNRSQYSSA